MTEKDFPEIDGDRRQALLRAAAQPATGEELKGAAEFTAALRTEVASGTAPVTPTTPMKRSTMFGSRLTRRSVAMVAATLLVAGTAAAAGGALRSTATPSVTSDTVAGTTDPGTTTPTSDTVLDTTGTVLDTVVDTVVDTTGPALVVDHATHEACEEWIEGEATEEEAALAQAAADEAGLPIDEFCALAAVESDDHEDDEDGDHEDDGDHAHLRLQETSFVRSQVTGDAHQPRTVTANQLPHGRSDA